MSNAGSKGHLKQRQSPSVYGSVCMLGARGPEEEGLHQNYSLLLKSNSDHAVLPYIYVLIHKITLRY